MSSCFGASNHFESIRGSAKPLRMIIGLSKISEPSNSKQGAMGTIGIAKREHEGPGDRTQRECKVPKTTARNHVKGNPY